jgi:hypothetical protein
MAQIYFTIPQLGQHFRVADWQARKAADALTPPVPRAGLYRLIPSGRLREVEAELRRRGWLRQVVETAG